MSDSSLTSNERLHSGMPEVEWLAILARDDKYASVEHCDVPIQDRRALIAAVKRMAERLAPAVETSPPHCCGCAIGLDCADKVHWHLGEAVSDCTFPDCEHPDVTECGKPAPHPDTVRLEWLLQHVSGKEWRRLGVLYGDGPNRTLLNDAMAASQLKSTGDAS